jgi:hypothetical protein
MKNRATYGSDRAASNECPPLFTRRKLAWRWSCSLETLKRAERAGKLPFLKLGRGVRYRREVIEAIEREAEVTR